MSLSRLSGRGWPKGEGLPGVQNRAAHHLAMRRFMPPLPPQRERVAEGRVRACRVFRIALPITWRLPSSALRAPSPAEAGEGVLLWAGEGVLVWAVTPAMRITWR